MASAKAENLVIKSVAGPDSAENAGECAETGRYPARCVSDTNQRNERQEIFGEFSRKTDMRRQPTRLLRIPSPHPGEFDALLTVAFRPKTTRSACRSRGVTLARRCAGEHDHRRDDA